jgi:HAD superfamily hydrolase (TIGR01459 family)
MSTPRFENGIGAFADRYEGFLLDQWGVIHDGRRVLPEAVAALVELKRRNKRLVVLSNSGRRASLNQRRLVEMGLDVAMFDAVVTSGEAAWGLLRHRTQPGFRDLGRRCVLFTIGGDRGVLDDLGIDAVDVVEDADFLFNTGLEIPPRTLDEYRQVLERAAERGLPMVCSNPDRVAPSQGRLITAPGTVAAMYEQMGCDVLYVGKPHAPIYGACLDALQGLEPTEIVAVGDSVEHDVRGANGVGIDCCFVMGGIHQEEFPPEASPAEREGRLADLCQRFGARPRWVVPRLVW